MGSGLITGISFRNALNLEACSGGLRVKGRTLVAFDFSDRHFDSLDELRLMETKRRRAGSWSSEATHRSSRQSD